MITINDKIKLEIEKELISMGRENPKMINGFAFNKDYDLGNVSDLIHGRVKVLGINCYYQAGVLDGENVYGQYIPTNPEGNLNLYSLTTEDIQQLNVGGKK